MIPTFLYVENIDINEKEIRYKEKQKNSVWKEIDFKFMTCLRAVDERSLTKITFALHFGLQLGK